MPGLHLLLCLPLCWVLQASAGVAASGFYLSSRQKKDAGKMESGGQEIQEHLIHRKFKASLGYKKP